MSAYGELQSLISAMAILGIIATATDYDCWKAGEESVTIGLVFAQMKNNAEKVKNYYLIR